VPVVDDVKRLLLHRFGAVLVAALLASIVLIQGPKLLALEHLRQLAVKNQARKMAAENARPSQEQIAKWEREVPGATIAEPSQFLVSLEYVAMQSGCTLGNTGDTPATPVEKAGALASIDTSVQVSGPYEALLKFLQMVRAEPRVMAVTRFSITASQHPRLQAEMSIRRYVRRADTLATLR